jgi:hypothetical protein
LTKLDLSETWITSLEPLSGLKDLTWLRLQGTQITSLAPLSGLTELIHLDLERTRVSDLRPIKNLVNLGGKGTLSGLFFEGCAATKIDPKLKALSQIHSAQKTREYLNQLLVWPPDDMALAQMRMTKVLAAPSTDAMCIVRKLVELGNQAFSFTEKDLKPLIDDARRIVDKNPE